MCIQKREKLKEKKRIVIKIGSSSLTHRETGKLNLLKIEKLVRILCDLRGEGRDVVLFLPELLRQEGRLLAVRPVRPAFPRNRHMQR